MSSRLPGALFLLFFFIPLGTATAQLETGPPPSELRVQTVDRKLLSRIVQESGADTIPPRPGAFAYLGELGQRFMKWLFGALAPVGHYAGALGIVFGLAADVLVGIAAALVVFLLGRWLYRWQRRRPEVERADVIAGEPVAPPRMWSSAMWQEELLKRLDRSDVPGSLEALWWWLARSVIGSRVKESWTSGDLLMNAGRPGLSQPIRVLERMMYGSRRPSVGEVRELARSLEEQLA